MPRFSVKDLLIATTLVAIGLAMLGFVPAVFGVHTGDTPTDVQGMYFVVAVVLIGAGLGTPFHRPFTGATLCMVVVVIAFHVWFKRPGWIFTLIAGALALIFWLPWLKRFSLRTPLIGTTLIAVVLGIIVWILRAG